MDLAWPGGSKGVCIVHRSQMNSLFTRLFWIFIEFHQFVDCALNVESLSVAYRLPSKHFAVLSIENCPVVIIVRLLHSINLNGDDDDGEFVTRCFSEWDFSAF